MTIAEDFGKLVDLGNELLEGTKTLEGLVDEAAEKAGLAPKTVEVAPPAKVLSLVSRNPIKCEADDEPSSDIALSVDVSPGTDNDGQGH
jgi:hypothetical protein